MKNNNEIKNLSNQISKLNDEGLATLIGLLQAEVDLRAVAKSTKSTKKSVTKSEPKVQEVTKKSDPHYIIKGNDLWILYKDPKESGSFQYNRVSKAIKLSATKDFGARFTGDYNQKVWKWTFQKDSDRKAFQKAQKERA